MKTSLVDRRATPTAGLRTRPRGPLVPGRDRYGVLHRGQGHSLRGHNRWSLSAQSSAKPAVPGADADGPPGPREPPGTRRPRPHEFPGRPLLRCVSSIPSAAAFWTVLTAPTAFVVIAGVVLSRSAQRRP